MRSEYQKWTAREKEIVKATYQHGRKTTLAALQAAGFDRNTNSLQGFAHRLGLQTDKPHLWSHDENAIVAREYPRGGVEAVKHLVNRSSHAIIKHAQVIKATTKQRQTWTTKEIAILRREYAAGGMLGAKKAFPYRSIPSISAILSRERIKRVGLHWSDVELNALKQHYPNGGSKAVQDVLRALGAPRSCRAIQRKAQELRIHSHKYWSERELTILREVFPTGGSVAVMRLLPHRSQDSILFAASRRGIKIQRRDHVITSF